jgi:GDP-D-mannose dehydratase
MSQSTIPPTITHKLNKCRICKSESLTDVIDLGNQIITSRWPKYGDFSTPSTPVCLCLCNECGLVQLKETTNSSELYEYEYGYRSGISNTMRTHLLEYQREIVSKVDLQPGDTILDIGSNDSTMLQYYGDAYQRVGCDPTGSQFKEFYGDVALIPTYFTYDNFTGVYGSDRNCKIVSSISMFYDLPDPVQFAKDIHAVLADDGIWTCEQSYLLTMLRRNSIDTICHEHLEYYALSQVKRIADMSGFKIIDVSFNECNGGSFRVYFAKASSSKYSECTNKITAILQDEVEYGIMRKDTYITFMECVDTEVKKLRDFISWVNTDGKKVYIYGASTKGNCLLQYANITEHEIPYAVERNPSKYGKMTSTGIPIISEEEMRANPPAYLLVLPWHFKDEIIQRESAYLNNGGQLLFPFPEFSIAGNKPKVLVTGCNGMIAKYVIRDYVADSVLYGIQRSNNSSNPENNTTANITKITCDMAYDNAKLTQIITVIKPDIVIHLAGISSSKYALEHPIETLETNGIVTARICEVLYRLMQQTDNQPHTVCTVLQSPKSNSTATGVTLNSRPFCSLFTQGFSPERKREVDLEFSVSGTVPYTCKLFNASSCEIYKGHETYTVKEDDTHKYHLHPYSIAKSMGHDMVKFYRERYNMPFVNGVLFTIESATKRPEFLLNKVAKYLKARDFSQPLQVGHLDSTRNILHARDTASAIKTILSHPITQSTGDYNICGTETHCNIVWDLVNKLLTASGIAYEYNVNDGIFWLITPTEHIPIIKINKDISIGFDQLPTHINGAPDKLLALGWKPSYPVDSILAELINNKPIIIK